MQSGFPQITENKNIICSLYATAEIRVRRGARGFSDGSLLGRKRPRKNARATKYNEVYMRLAVALLPLVVAPLQDRQRVLVYLNGLVAEFVDTHLLLPFVIQPL